MCSLLCQVPLFEARGTSFEVVSFKFFQACTTIYTIGGRGRKFSNGTASDDLEEKFSGTIISLLFARIFIFSYETGKAVVGRNSPGAAYRGDLL